MISNFLHTIKKSKDIVPAHNILTHFLTFREVISLG